MGNTPDMRKTIFYIFIQIVTLWSIFYQMSETYNQNRFEVVGLLILLGVFFLYAHKTIRLLSRYSKSDHTTQPGIS